MRLCAELNILIYSKHVFRFLPKVNEARGPCLWEEVKPEMTPLERLCNQNSSANLLWRHLTIDPCLWPARSLFRGLRISLSWVHLGDLVEARQRKLNRNVLCCGIVRWMFSVKRHFRECSSFGSVFQSELTTLKQSWEEKRAEERLSRRKFMVILP